MKNLKIKYYPEFEFDNDGTRTKGRFGLGHETPEKAYQEGRRHSEKHKESRGYEKVEDIGERKFTNFVVHAYVPM